jgi:hypothetical protein
MLTGRQIIRTVTPLLVLFVAVDILFSLFSTCDQISHYPRQKYSAEKYCTAFSGPLIGDIWRICIWVGHILHEFDKEIVALFTVVLTLSTIALWWTTRRLWRATKETAQSQADDTRILQRAYISAAPYGISSTTDQYLIGHVVFENVGRLPAREFRWVVKGLTEGDKSWKPPIVPDAELERSTIVPIAGKFRRGTAKTVPRYIEEDRYLFVWGRVKYLDGFGVERFLDFCHSYPVARKKMDALDRSGYSISVKHARQHDYGNDGD